MKADITHIKIETCQFVCASDLIPEDWCGWFWSRLDEFTFGDANRTLIDAERFAVAVDNLLDDIYDELPHVTKSDVGRFESVLQELIKLRGVYVDLES